MSRPDSSERIKSMEIEELAAELYNRFRPEAASGVDMLLRLDVPDSGHLLLVVRDGTLAITTDVAAPDVTFRFENLATATAIIRGESDAIEAFMNGRFRADGYLMMAFKLMELFGSRSLPPTPND
jgi:putative sterol carrier protein